MGWGIFIVALVVIVVGFALYLGHLYEKNRTKAMGEIADSLGFDFAPKSPTRWLSTTTLPLFSQGRDRRHRNIMVGEGGDETVFIFDYQYTVGSGKHSQTHKQTVVGFESKLLDLPRFDMQPESFFHRIGEWFGSKDINFPENPIFSKRYFLRTDDDSRIREVFSKPVLDVLEKKTNLRLEGQAETMFFYRGGKRNNPKEIKDLLGEAYELYALLKKKV